MDEYAQTMLAQRISTITGVAQVQVFGSQKYAVRVQVDPRAMATLGVGIDEVQNAIAQSNVNLPTGTIYGQYQSFNVQATGQLTNAQAYKPLIVAYRNGSPVRLEQLGNVLDSVQTDKVASWYKDERAVILAIQRQPGTNTIEVVDSIKKILPTFKAQLPASVSLNILYDRSVSIRDSVGDVQFTLMLAIALVVMVIFLFLRNVSATIIPSLALPMSIVGTFAGMYALGYTIDNLSLMALTLGVGFVVDDAIVVLENIVRHMEEGMGRMEAALLGAREIGFTIVSMTLSLAAVFIPVLFMGGVVGRLLHEFAAVIAIAVIVSGVVSLTLTPMLCSRFLKPPAESHGRLYRASERVFDAMLSGYRRTLQLVLRHPQADVRGLRGHPGGDGGTVHGDLQGLHSRRGHRADLRLHRRSPGHLVRQHDGAPAGGGGHRAQAAVRGLVHVLHRREQHERGPEHRAALHPAQAAQGAARRGRDHPGAAAEAHGHSRIHRVSAEAAHHPHRGQPDQGGVPVHLAGRGHGRSSTSGRPSSSTRSAVFPGFLDVNSDLQVTSPQVLVEIDRDRASAMGVTASQIENALNNAYGAPQVSTIYTPTNQYWVMMELLPQFKDDPDALGMLYIRSTSGKLVPLNAVAKLTRSVGPLTVNHLGQLPAVTISFNLKPGVSLGDAVEEIRGLERELRVPATLTATFQGTAQAFQASVKGLGMLLLAAVLVIYLDPGHPLRELHPPLDHSLRACPRRAWARSSPS